MKRVALPPQPPPQPPMPIGASNVAPLPQPPLPAPVPVTHFDATPIPPGVHTDADHDMQEAAPVAAPPSFMAPAGPMPEPVKDPVGFEGFMAAALVARKNSLPFASLWANMAQAHALDRIAQRLDELVEFMGSRDGDQAEPARLADALMNGIASALEEAGVTGKKR